MQNKISVVITALNGEKTIKSCLESVRWADEIVVVDDGSIDNTVRIAKQFTDKIFHHKSQGFVEPARNFAIEKATGDWILILDADEQIPQSLAKKLRDLTNDSIPANNVKLPRKNIIFSKWIEHTGWWPDYNLRFFRKGSVVWSDKIHSQPETKGEVFEIEPKEEFAIIHHNYDSISLFLRKLDTYTTVSSNEIAATKKDFIWTKILSAPFEEFLSRYFARKGYKDGLHGLVLSILMAFYEFIIYLKLWEQHSFTEVGEKEMSKGFKQVRDSQKQLHFWIYNKKIDEASNIFKKSILKVRRKVRV